MNVIIAVDFYPRPPRGGRPGFNQVPRLDITHFYPRPPRGGRPCPAWPGFCGCCYFYPRPPRGGRPEIDSYLEETKLISIHALREEGDLG